MGTTSVATVVFNGTLLLLPFFESGGVIVGGGVIDSLDSRIGEEEGIIEGSDGVVPFSLKWYVFYHYEKNVSSLSSTLVVK